MGKEYEEMIGKLLDISKKYKADLHFSSFDFKINIDYVPEKFYKDGYSPNTVNVYVNKSYFFEGEKMLPIYYYVDCARVTSEDFISKSIFNLEHFRGLKLKKEDKVFISNIFFKTNNKNITDIIYPSLENQNQLIIQ